MAQLTTRAYLTVTSSARQLIWREEGQDTIEYGLVAVMISIAALSVVVLFGPELRNWYQDIVNAMP